MPPLPTESPTPTTLVDLPHEVLLEIFRFTDAQLLYSMAWMCRALHEAGLTVLFKRYTPGLLTSDFLKLKQDHPPFLLSAVRGACFIRRIESITIEPNCVKMFSKDMMVLQDIIASKTPSTLNIELQFWSCISRGRGYSSELMGPIHPDCVGTSFQAFARALMSVVNVALAKGCPDITVTSAPGLRSRLFTNPRRDKIGYRSGSTVFRKQGKVRGGQTLFTFARLEAFAIDGNILFDPLLRDWTFSLLRKTEKLELIKPTDQALDDLCNLKLPRLRSLTCQYDGEDTKFSQFLSCYAPQLEVISLELSLRGSSGITMAFPFLDSLTGYSTGMQWILEKGLAHSQRTGVPCFPRASGIDIGYNFGGLYTPSESDFTLRSLQVLKPLSRICHQFEGQQRHSPLWLSRLDLTCDGSILRWIHSQAQASDSLVRNLSSIRAVCIWTFYFDPDLATEMKSLPSFLGLFPNLKIVYIDSVLARALRSLGIQFRQTMEEIYHVRVKAMWTHVDVHTARAVELLAKRCGVM